MGASWPALKYEFNKLGFKNLIFTTLTFNTLVVLGSIKDQLTLKYKYIVRVRLQSDWSIHQEGVLQMSLFRLVNAFNA